jgi:predicted MPP superfamily phosphohydrolase
MLPIIEASRTGTPLVLLAHDPASFMNISAEPAIMLAGHTHGGQVRFPLIGPLHTSSRAPMSWIYGHTIDRGRDIFVSGGVGTSLLPIRFNMPPEIVMMELASAGLPLVSG